MDAALLERRPTEQPNRVALTAARQVERTGQCLDWRNQVFQRRLSRGRCDGLVARALAWTRGGGLEQKGYVRRSLCQDQRDLAKPRRTDGSRRGGGQP